MNHSAINIREDRQWNTVLLIGGIAALLTVGCTFFDIVFGSISSADLAAIPHTAAGRFEELHSRPFLGLYHFDLLNVFISVVMVPTSVYPIAGSTDTYLVTPRFDRIERGLPCRRSMQILKSQFVFGYGILNHSSKRIS